MFKMAMHSAACHWSSYRNVLHWRQLVVQWSSGPTGRDLVAHIGGRRGLVTCNTLHRSKGSLRTTVGADHFSPHNGFPRWTGQGAGHVAPLQCSKVYHRGSSKDQTTSNPPEAFRTWLAKVLTTLQLVKAIHSGSARALNFAPSLCVA